MDREKTIVKTSVIGIVANVFLASFKAVIGILANSIAITMDAVNNLSDVLSSVITIIGTKLAAKAPDKKHPLGHGRIEYLTAMIIAVIILYAGFAALIECGKKVIHPKAPSYAAIQLVIIAVAVLVKIVLGTYVKKTGEKVNSDSLVASGKDALFDAIISSATLVAALIFMLTGLSLESYLGIIISVMIIKSGFEILGDTFSELLGKRIDSELSRQVKNLVCTFPEVKGAYDLVLHNYGPDRLVGSLHVEVPANMTVKELDKLQRGITEKVLIETGVIITGVSVYAINDGDEESIAIEKKVREVAAKYPEVLEIHGFSFDRSEKRYLFDVIVDYDNKNRKEIYDKIISELNEAYPQYQACATLDVDMSD